MPNHVGDDPKTRLGGFKKFSGQLATNSNGGIQSLSMEFDRGSLSTEIGGGGRGKGDRQRKPQPGVGQ